MTKYVAGLLFNDEGTYVALIHKDHGPAHLIDKWNAIGGKVEASETNNQAMFREFIQEADVDLRDHNASWKLFLILHGLEWEVSFYKAFSTSALSKASTTSSERVAVFGINFVLKKLKIVDDLQWIIPMSSQTRITVYNVFDA